MCVGVLAFLILALLTLPTLAAGGPIASGGGWFYGSDGERNQFGFNVHDGNSPKGSLEYHGKDFGIKVKSYEMLEVSENDGYVHFSGAAMVDTGDGWEEGSFAATVFDAGEPGNQGDWFEISVFVEGVEVYYGEGLLNGGNIQVRPSSDDGVVA